MSEWMPVETAPKDGTSVLLRYYKGTKTVFSTTSREHVITQAYFKPRQYDAWGVPYGNEWCDALGRLICSLDTGKKKNVPTHWMPLPAPPLPDANGGRE